MRSLAFVLLALAACGAPKSPAPPGPGASAASCDAARAPVTALYQAEAAATHQDAHDPTFVADNVAMVMRDCATDPARVAGCAAHAASVTQLEHDCLIPIDDQCSEGEAIAR